eukprot:8665702-Pyramimonas_sp.AAC.1
MSSPTRMPTSLWTPRRGRIEPSDGSVNGEPYLSLGLDTDIWRPVSVEPYLHVGHLTDAEEAEDACYGDQSQGSHRVYTCMGTNHRGATGYTPVWGPITGEPPGIYLHAGHLMDAEEAGDACYGDQSQGSRR